MGNFIKNLQNDIEEHKMSKDDTMMAICDLAQYLNLPKFSCGDELDGYVNVDDVRRYLILIKEALSGRDDNLKLQ